MNFGSHIDPPEVLIHCNLCQSSKVFKSFPLDYFEVFLASVESLDYIFAADTMSLSSLKFAWCAPKEAYCNKVRNIRSW